jgi:2-keto-4-pentenoate hydratase/2-oxohepta-3-ene-1,7-dioic acid hydratase in catechol pathway
MGQFPMVQRYVRAQTTDGKIHYGVLALNHEIQVCDAPPWRQEALTEKILAADSYQLLAPCVPSKIIGIGRNYADHALEMQSDVPKEPLIFLKPPTTAIGPEQSIPYPAMSQRVEYEGELALVIGKRCRNCSPAEAPAYIWGYTIANDVTARDLQHRDDQWTRAKGFDGFCPLGPWIVRSFNGDASLQTFVNGEANPRQSSTLDKMIFAPPVLVSYLSQIMTLLPGDVILTGTPAGVGPLAVGDRVRVKIEGIGELENGVVSAGSD